MLSVVDLWSCGSHAVTVKEKKPTWQARVERTLKDSLEAQRDSLDIQRETLCTAKLILAAINQSHEVVITINPGVPRFASKASLPHGRHGHFHGHGHKINN